MLKLLEGRVSPHGGGAETSGAGGGISHKAPCPWDKGSSGAKLGSTHLGQKPAGLRGQCLGLSCGGLIRGNALALRKPSWSSHAGGRGGTQVCSWGRPP